MEQDFCYGVLRTILGRCALAASITEIKDRFRVSSFSLFLSLSRFLCSLIDRMSLASGVS